MKVSCEISNALREEASLPSAKLEALRDFTLAVVRQRGALEEKQVQDFYLASFTRKSVLEVILGLSQKIMSNYTHHLAQTSADKAFTQFLWEKTRLFTYLSSTLGAKSNTAMMSS